VLGKPWHIFIHQDFEQRTIGVIKNASITQKTQRLQCYKHKLGGYFFTNDLFHVFSDAQDNPVSAVVTVRIEHEYSHPVQRRDVNDFRCWSDELTPSINKQDVESNKFGTWHAVNDCDVDLLTLLSCDPTKS